MIDRKRVLSVLGLAQKAGKLSSGEFNCERSIRRGTAKLVIISEDASNNTKKKFANMSDHRGLEAFFFGSKEELGKSIGKGMRSVIVIRDDGFAKLVSNLLEQAK